MPSNGNFAILNTLVRPVGGTSRTTSNGNTTISSSSGSWGTPVTLAANTGKWYIEFYVNAGSSGRNVGVVPTNSPKYNDGDYSQGGAGDYAITLNSSGALYNNGTQTQTVASNMATGDIMSIAMNLDASPKTVQFYKNGSTIGSAENINSSATGPYTFMTKGHNQSTVTMNAGQDSSFSGAKTSGSANAADDNGFGDFYYTPPSGFLSMTSANLPISADIDPAQTNDNYPGKQFNAISWTGDGTTSRAITGLGFQPDFIWFKDATQAFSNRLYDTSRGINSNGGKRLASNAPNEENDQTSGQDISAVGTDGFTLGASSANYTNYSSDVNVAWCWKANGGTTSSNTDGSTTTTVQTSQAGGFSIILYTGTGSNATIGHGLSSAPEFILVKRRSYSQNWAVYHESLGNTYNGVLNDTQAWSTSSLWWQNTTPSNSVISIGTEGRVNGSGQTYVAYAWHSVEGYSKIGKYEGNGNTDGTFVYTGFRPKMIMIRRWSGTDSYFVYDTARSTSNVMGNFLQWNNTDAQTGSGLVDFVSTGFKWRATSASQNPSGTTMIYAAWGDVPAKYGNTF